MSVLRVLIRDSLRPLRLLVALCSLTWAASLYLPGDAISEAPYTIMAALLPEYIWGTLFLIAGIANWVIVCKDLQSLKITTVISICTSLLWTITIASIFYSYWVIPELSPFFPPTHMASDFWIAVTAWWLLVINLADLAERCNKHGSNN